MRHLVLAFLAVFALALPASGQGWSMTVWFQQTIAVQAARLDLIKAAQGDPPLRGYIDAVWTQTNPTTNETELRVQGWGFECAAYDLTALDLRLNAFIKDITPLIVRYPRSDVASDPDLSSWCPNWIPLYSGLDMTIPLGQLLPGWYDIRLRLWDAAGHSYTTNSIWMLL